MNYELIVATTKDGWIGTSDGSLPFKQRADMLNFKKLTTGNTVVMGSNTFRSLGCKPLPNRINVVMGRDYTTGFNPLEGRVFIIGGEIIYKYALENLNITRIHHTIVDVEFPEATKDWARFDLPEGWVVETEIAGKADDKNQYDYVMRELTK